MASRFFIFIVVLAGFMELSFAGPPRRVGNDQVSLTVVRSDAGDDQVWLKEQGQAKVYLGTIRNLSRSWPLWHWDNRNVKQLRKDFPKGKVPPGFTESLGESTLGLTTGNGFYVSKDPFDSQRFGKNQWVVSSKKDLRTLEAVRTPQLTGTIGNHVWEELNPLLASLQIDAIGVSATSTWYNLISAAALTDVHVAQSVDVLHYLSMVQPSRSYLIMLRQDFPEIESDPIFQRAWQESEIWQKALTRMEAQDLSWIDDREFSPEMCLEIRSRLREVQINRASVIGLVRKGYGREGVDLETLLAVLHEESLRSLLFDEILKSPRLISNERVLEFMSQNPSEFAMAKLRANSMAKGERCEKLFF